MDSNRATFLFSVADMKHMLSNTTIRHAEQTDISSIQSVARSSWHAAYDDILGSETVDRMVDEWYTRDALEAAIDRSIFYIAAYDSEIVGFSNAGQISEDGSSFELFRIYVREQHWGNQIGTALLESTINAVVDAGGTTLELSVLAENSVGIRFYEHRGFDRRSEQAVALNGDTYAEYRYEKRVT